MAHTIVMTRIPQGYSGCDHLVDSDDEARVRALIGKSYRDFRAAELAAHEAFVSGCDRRVRGIPIKIATRDARGKFHGPLAAEAELDAKRRAESKFCRRCREYIHPTDPADCPRGDRYTDPYHDCT
jgi:hypothetical protein